MANLFQPWIVMIANADEWQQGSLRTDKKVMRVHIADR